MIDMQLARTLAVIKQLADGKRLTLPTGTVIMMGEDFSVGCIIPGTDRISGFTDLTIRDLNRLCEKHEIGMPIPSSQK